MAEGSSGSGNSAVALGMLFGFIGALAGYGAHQGGGAIAGALAGFALGAAIVKAVKYAAILALAATSLALALGTIERSAEHLGTATDASAGE